MILVCFTLTGEKCQTNSTAAEIQRREGNFTRMIRKKLAFIRSKVYFRDIFLGDHLLELIIRGAKVWEGGTGGGGGRGRGKWRAFGFLAPRIFCPGAQDPTPSSTWSPEDKNVPSGQMEP